MTDPLTPRCYQNQGMTQTDQSQGNTEERLPDILFTWPGPDTANTGANAGSPPVPEGP